MWRLLSKSKADTFPKSQNSLTMVSTTRVEEYELCHYPSINDNVFRTLRKGEQRPTHGIPISPEEVVVKFEDRASPASFLRETHIKTVFSDDGNLSPVSSQQATESSASPHYKSKKESDALIHHLDTLVAENRLLDHKLRLALHRNELMKLELRGIQLEKKKQENFYKDELRCIKNTNRQLQEKLRNLRGNLVTLYEKALAIAGSVRLLHYKWIFSQRSDKEDTRTRDGELKRQ